MQTSVANTICDQFNSDKDHAVVNSVANSFSNQISSISDLIVRSLNTYILVVRRGKSRKRRKSKMDGTQREVIGEKLCISKK